MPLVMHIDDGSDEELAICLCLNDVPDERTYRQTRSKLLSPQNDGKSFRIGVRERQAVQVVKWQDSKSPIEAILSDSFSTIRGRFSDDATARYMRDKKADVRANTKGAILKITDFDIVVSQGQSATPNITLFIRAFEILGCEGTGTFGSPREISSFPVISALARQCQAIGSVETHEHLGISPVQPQPGVTAVEYGPPHSSEPCLASQAVFSTQLENKKMAEFPKPSKPLPMNSPPRLPSQDLLAFLTSNARKHNIAKNLNAPTPDPSSPGNKSSRDEHAMPPPSMQKANTPVRSREEFPKSLHYPNPVLAGQCPPNHEKCSLETNANETVSSEPLIAKVCQEGKKKSQSPSSVLARQSSQTNEIGTATVNSKPSSSSKPSGRRGSTIADDADPWRNWKRIRRRDVFIPADQQELIDSPDSWVPPATGQSLPPGRVPLKLLQKWNEIQITSNGLRDAETKQNEEPHEPEEQGEPLTAQESVQSSISSSSSASEFDVELWPPSSPAQSDKRRVPPDSSPPRLPLADKSNNPPSGGRTQENSKTHRPLDSHTNDSDLPQRNCVANMSALPFQLPAESEPGDDSDNLDIEFSVLRGLENSTQENHTRNLESTQEESVASSGTPLPKKTSFTQVKQSPETTPSRVKTRIRATLPQHAEQQHDLANGNIDSSNRLTSDVVIPATFVSDDVRLESQFDVEEQVGETSTPAPADSSDCDGDMAREQLASELGECIGDVGSQTKNALFQRAISSTDAQKSAENSPVSPRLSLGRTTPSNCQRKRKWDGDYTTPLRSPKRRLVESDTIERAAGSHATTNPKELVCGMGPRRNYFRVASPSSIVEKIYMKFKQAYSTFSGDVHAFTNSCLKLQSLRSKGLFEKSILWDDFVCCEATQYQDYVQRCRKRKELPEPYERYFLERVTVPSFRKRNLTGKSLELILAWCNQAQNESENEDLSENEFKLIAAKRGEALEQELRERSRKSSTSDSEVTGTKTSRRDSQKRRDSYSIPDSEEWRGYEAHEVASVELGDSDDSRILSGAQKRSFLEYEELGTEVESPRPLTDETTASPDDIDDRHSQGQPKPSSQAVEPISETDGIADDECAIPEPKSRSKSKGKQPQSLTDYLGRKATSWDDGSSMDEDFYTTDSVYPPYRPPKSPPINQQEDNVTATEQPASPSSNWWRDSNTPFKSFARSYVNLHSELGRHRQRGNAEAVPVDENGVILPQMLFGSSNKPVEGRMNSMGWKW
ncbi:hypothetical protein PRK78_005144 [Emydomyces testavorans]|uniref:Shelterin complex subunit TPP1/Est3 domain-containing protein n=1 Tax=Emydomyces testavorans TaxID=2070801 RepID=A0AAF0IJ86_9EURO|nr:hypothetical protein PRK78_005144 [Emydomyces testavorans]